VKTILLSSLAAALTALAVPTQAQTAPLTRAEVMAEYERAQQSGQLNRASDEIGSVAALRSEALSVASAAPASGLTRDEVYAELVRAQEAGETDWAHFEAYGTMPRAGRVKASDIRLHAAR
jgi:hypothetical protein